MCAALLMGVALLTPRTVSFAPSAILYPRHWSQNHRTQIQINPSHQCLLSSTTSGDLDISTDDDLTKEELLLRLSETRAYYRERPKEGMTQEAICLKLLSTRLPDLHLNRSFVANSTIPNAGYGLFASRDIKDGELITLYPGDAVVSKGKKKKSAGPICSIMFGAHTKPEHRDTNRVLTHDARGYEMEMSAYTSIVGDPSIGFSDKSCYIGHFANDGGYLREFDDASRKAYKRETLERCNAANFVLEGAHMGTVAIKPIEKGSEVFLSYGEGYWLSRSDSDSAGKERDNILVEIESNMGERRKIKRATTLTASGVGQSTVAKSSTIDVKDGKGNKKSKKKKSKRKKNSIDSGTKTQGFGFS